MSEIQILTLAIAIVFPALGVMGSIAAVLFSNKRIDDLREEMKAMEKRLIEHIDNAFTHMGLLLELHEAKHHKP